MQYRQALFFSAASIAGAFSGLLAFGIAKMDGVGNYAGWRWIFILEGLLTVIVGVLSFWTLYDFPDTAPFLTPEEREWVTHRLSYQGTSPGSRKVAQADRFQWKYVKAAFSDPQIYVGLISMYPPRRGNPRPFSNLFSVLGNHDPPLWHRLLSAHHNSRLGLQICRRTASHRPYVSSYTN